MASALLGMRGGGVGAVRWLADGRVVLAANQAPADIVSLQDEACEAQGSPCPERFIGLTDIEFHIRD